MKMSLDILPNPEEHGDSAFNSMLTLSSIKKKLADNGSSIHACGDLMDRKEQLSKAKSKYLAYKLIFEEIKDVTNSRKSTESPSEQYHSLMKDTFTRAQLKHICKFPYSHKEEEVRVLGIKNECIDLNRKKKQSVCQALQQYFIPELEKSFQKKCRFLYELYTPINSHGNEALLFSKSCQLPLFVDNQIKKIDEFEVSLKTKRKENWDSKEKYLKALLLELELARDLLGHEGFRSSTTNMEVKVKLLAAKCEALQLKISVLKGQLLKDSYSEETVEALRKVKEHLLDAIADTENRLAKSKESLLVYKSAGPELEALAKQFLQITTDIDNKKWALSQLKSTIKRTESIDV